MEQQHSLLFDHLSFQRQQDENGTVVLHTNVKSEHLQDEGTVNSGLFSIMLDTAIGTVISKTLDGFGVTIQLSVNIFDNTKKDYFVCKASVKHDNANIAYGEGTVFDPEGNIAANGQASFKVISLKK